MKIAELVAEVRHPPTHIPPERDTILRTLYRLYVEHTGSPETFEQAIGDVTHDDIEHVGGPKSEFHPEHEWRPVYWADHLSATGSQGLRKFAKANPNLLRPYGWLVSRVSFADFALERLETDPKEVTQRYLYHVTPADRVPSILEHGLLPRESDGEWLHNYPARVYLVNTKRDMKLVLRKFQEIDEMKKRNRSYAILRIDRKKLPPVTFHADPQFAGKRAFFTSQPIPPDAISVLETVPAG